MNNQLYISIQHIGNQLRIYKNFRILVQLPNCDVKTRVLRIPQRQGTISRKYVCRWGSGITGLRGTSCSCRTINSEQRPRQQWRLGEEQSQPSWLKRNGNKLKYITIQYNNSWINLHWYSELEKLTRAGFELSSSGYRTAALPTELSSQLGTICSFYPL